MNSRLYTIGQVSKRFGVSRSTLLYYEAIGLLVASRRSEPNYRLYSEQDLNRMKQIAIYRKVGLPLKVINQLLSLETDQVASTLEMRLIQINEEINRLRKQQQIIIQLLQNKEILCKSRILNKTQWVALLEATGLNEDDMHKWHIEFEKLFPEAHQDFLESLGIPLEEILVIRAWSKNITNHE